jgi:hypothetical protein
MRKALLPMLASLLFCGAATAALIATNAHAGQTSATHKPVMMLAQNQAPATPGLDGAPPPRMGRGMMRDGERGQLCENMYARKAGELAFLETKLQLTSAQQPLFARWKDISMDLAKRHEGDCTSLMERARAGQRPDMMERLSREEDRLKTRLADIQAERPSLSALYASLNPTQKEEFGRAAMRAMGGRARMAMGMMGRGRAPEMGRRFGRGPAGEPPLPPPPPQ